MNSELRNNCPMRHENGNCLPCGGFCTAVIDPICEAIHNAYGMGKRFAEPVKHGEWISIVNYRSGKPDGRYYCSVCHRVETMKGIYCRLCGARMDGGNK